MGDHIDVWYNDEELKTLVAKAGTDDKTKVAKYIKNKILDAEIKEELDKDEIIKTKRIENLEQQNIKLKLGNRLTLIHEFHLAPSIAIAITENKISLDEVLSPNKAKMQEYENKIVEPTSWIHSCKSAGRNVELENRILECNYCGAKK